MSYGRTCWSDQSVVWPDVKALLFEGYILVKLALIRANKKRGKSENLQT